jgi:hypothetical protein
MSYVKSDTILRHRVIFREDPMPYFLPLLMAKSSVLLGLSLFSIQRKDIAFESTLRVFLPSRVSLLPIL